MATTLATAAFTTLTKAFSSYRQSHKEEQQLDPIATICMLAMRNLQSFDGSKPAVCGHCFYYDKPGLFQGILRLKTAAGHEDLGLLYKSIEFFVTYYKAEKGSHLVSIVEYALKGLEKTSDPYNGAYSNVLTTITLYKTMITNWLNETPSKETESKQANKNNDKIFLNKITNVWTKERIDLFYDLYMKGYSQNLEIFFTSQRELYLVELTKDTPPGAVV